MARMENISARIGTVTSDGLSDALVVSPPVDLGEGGEAAMEKPPDFSGGLADQRCCTRSPRIARGRGVSVLGWDVLVGVVGLAVAAPLLASWEHDSLPGW